MKAKGVFIMSKVTINVRVNKDDKEQAKNLFEKMGLDMSTAINMFIKQALAEQGLPFRPRIDIPKRIVYSDDKELLSKLAEGEKSLNSGKSTSGEEFFTKMSEQYGFKL